MFLPPLASSLMSFHFSQLSLSLKIYNEMIENEEVQRPEEANLFLQVCSSMREGGEVGGREGEGKGKKGTTEWVGKKAGKGESWEGEGMEGIGEKEGGRKRRETRREGTVYACVWSPYQHTSLYPN